MWSADGHRAGVLVLRRQTAGNNTFSPEHAFYLTTAGRRTIGKMDEADKDYPYRFKMPWPYVKFDE